MGGQTFVTKLTLTLAIKVGSHGSLMESQSEMMLRKGSTTRLITSAIYISPAAYATTMNYTSRFHKELIYEFQAQRLQLARAKAIRNPE